MKKTIKANFYFINLISCIVFLLLYFILSNFITVKFTYGGWKNCFIIIIGVSLTVFIHEIIHGAAVALFIPIKHIELKFYLSGGECRIHKDITRNQYIFYTIAPALFFSITGILLYYILPSENSKSISALLSLIGISGCGGDFWFAGQVIKYDKKSMILDKGLELEITCDNEI